jgi:hypothetical protein
MKFFITLYAAVLFIIFTPSIFFTISKKYSKKIITFIHAILFAFVFHFTNIYFFYIYESNSGVITYKPDPDSKFNPNGPPVATQCNASTLGKSNYNGDICEQDNSKNYKWVTPCTLSNVGIKNSNGQICTNQNNNIFNWV